MAVFADQSTLVNALATPDQLETSVSRLDGVPADLEASTRFAGCRLTQAAGVLLRLPQDIIAQAIIIFTRFWIGPEGGSLKEYDVQDISAAALYLTTKPSAHPRSPRSILNTYAYLTTTTTTTTTTTESNPTAPEPPYYLPESTYHARRTQLTAHEAVLLRTLGFATHAAVPHALCIHYLQALEAVGPLSAAAAAGAADDDDHGARLAQRALAHLNAALLSPQLLYVTHQPAALATAAIYLAARETGTKLPEGEWWVVFDTEREELGFLVVAMNSVVGFVEKEAERWGVGGDGGGGGGWMGRGLLTVAGVEKEIAKRAVGMDAEEARG